MTIQVERLTADQVRNSERRDYNPREWDKVVDRYIALDGTFLQDVGNKFRPKIYVIYKADGINFLAELGYTSSLSSSTFRIAVLNGSQLDLLDVTATRTGRVLNDAYGRKYMQSCSEYFGTVFTNEF